MRNLTADVLAALRVIPSLRTPRRLPEHFRAERQYADEVRSWMDVYDVNQPLPITVVER